MRFAVKARKIGKIVIKRRDDGMAVFEGAGVALITPFKDNGEINYEKRFWRSRLREEPMRSLPAERRERRPR